MPQRTVLIADRPIGPDHPCYIVAEIGINHNGDMALAREMITAARDCGADAVKFQTYSTDDFVADRSLLYSYLAQGQIVTEAQYDMFKRCELSDQQVVELFNFAQSVGVDFHSTPTSLKGLRLLQQLGVGVLKNGSDFLGHLPLIRWMGETGLPTVLSTGMSEAHDIERAVRAFRSSGNENLILLHCVSKYPTLPHELNLRRMVSLRDTFGCLVGFSDHSEGAMAANIAVGLGACWIEKHFTMSRNHAGPDQRFSSDPAEFARLVSEIRLVEAMLGSPKLVSGDLEAVSKADFRLSCAAARDMLGGHRVSSGDIAFFRPGTGIPPSDVETLVGRVLGRPVQRGHIFAHDDFIPATKSHMASG